MSGVFWVVGKCGQKKKQARRQGVQLRVGRQALGSVHATHNTSTDKNASVVSVGEGRPRLILEVLHMLSEEVAVQRCPERGRHTKEAEQLQPHPLRICAAGTEKFCDRVWVPYIASTNVVFRRTTTTATLKQKLRRLMLSHLCPLLVHRRIAAFHLRMLKRCINAVVLSAAAGYCVAVSIL
ncbi:hypothetical protein, conserved [Leishmania tarentolae]|uniref:Uncharacterized protein n=1 Tax=Leishmania tarentolae TaxID=5689 RepID=A0A640KXG7_LEITA|nr:hypothetical protein, conserved [Leishmania tarentolae]